MKTAEFAPSGCRCEYCLSKKTSGLSIGDRDLPLEADPLSDPVRNDPMIGKMIEVSAIAGGELQGLVSSQVEVTGVFYRFGVVVGYEVKSEKGTFSGSRKDFYVDREYLEDIQPPTATSSAIRSGMSHWAVQRDYWHDQIAGIEALCFELASITPRAAVSMQGNGWQFSIPDPLPGDSTVIDCRVVAHDNFWSLSTMVFPQRCEAAPSELVLDHWERTFRWAYEIVSRQGGTGTLPWEAAARNLKLRHQASSKILVPLVQRTLARASQAKEELTGNRCYFPPGSVSVGFSEVRLKAGTIGMTECPTDRRPYSVMTISAGALKKPGYLEQVVLHECIHMAVASTGGPAHNDEFNALAAKLGLSEDNRD